MWYLIEGDAIAKIILLDKSPDFREHPGCYSISPGYKTREELIKDNEILDEPCRCCGVAVKSRWVEETKRKIIESNLCFSCQLWDERAKTIMNNPKVVVVDHEMYTLGPDLSPDYRGFRGFGGHQFSFMRISDGELIKCSNVWSGGTVPERFWSRIPNSAVLFYDDMKVERQPLLTEFNQHI